VRPRGRARSQIFLRTVGEIWSVEVVNLVVLASVLRGATKKIVNFFAEKLLLPEKILATPMVLYIVLVLVRAVIIINLVTLQILFLGDSTNRGMTHYMTERLNGSLTEWDRTHDTRVYDNINSAQTVISFAYYPQFWMPPGQRPLFDASLLQLMKTYVYYTPANTVNFVSIQ